MKTGIGNRDSMNLLNQWVRFGFAVIVCFDSHLTLAQTEWVPVGDSGRPDSALVRANTDFNKVSAFHRMLFGENYRKEWDTQTKLPLIRISEIAGGLKPIKRGGGFQSVTLRLEDSTGKEWVIRSINKSSAKLVPEVLHGTLAEDIVDDANSAQHPYAALIVPPIAKAVGVPHAKPMIGIVMPDSALGEYHDLFANTLNLIEEREPEGDSDNTPRMLERLFKDHDNTYKAKVFFRARLLDLLLGDWDRHGDQWRWRNVAGKSEKDYLPVPRDRDQVFRLTQGIIPTLASMPFTLPDLRGLQGFGPWIANSGLSMLKSNFLHAHPKAQFSYDKWMSLVNDFVEDVTDSVLHESVSRLPLAAYRIRHEQLINDLRRRRDAMPAALSDYYRFINRVVDVRASDKHEHIAIQHAEGNALRVIMRKINKHGEVTKKLMDKTYTPDLTKEIRIYLGEGNDSVFIDNRDSPIRLRVTVQGGAPHFKVRTANRRTAVYGVNGSATFSGSTASLKLDHRADSASTAFKPVNLHNVWMPLITAGYNADDGVSIGGGFRYTHYTGFRKTPFAHRQQFVISSAFATGAFRIRYNGHWADVIGRTDVLLGAAAYVPNNTQNYFGYGNATVYDRRTQSLGYHRARFELYEVNAALQWNWSGHTLFAVGPVWQLYRFDPHENTGRFIGAGGAVHTYDSLFISKSKAFSGIKASYRRDRRDRKILTTQGGYLLMEVQGTTGLNQYSRSFVQAKSEMGYYTHLANGSVVLSGRMGGGITVGNTAFYQSLFLGGHDNLRGFRHHRFAGDHLFFTNVDARIRLAEVRGYIAPGELGVVAFHDAGKIWASGYNSDRVHQSIGGGIYFAPAKRMLMQFIMGHSREGWYPYLTLGTRF